MPVDLSVVVAVYNEDPRNLLSLLDRLRQIIPPTGMTYELVFVNDGSRAPASKALRDIVQQVDYAKLVELSRNFGQQPAITAGMDHAEGRAIVNIDSDLQDPPELIPEMLKLWQDGYDVVYAQRAARKDRLGKRLSAFLFYRILGAFAQVQIPWDTGDYRLIDRRVYQALRSLPEKTRFLRGMVPWLGFRQIGIAIARDAREVGESTYTFRKLLSLAADGLLSFSVMPLYLIPIIGAALMALGLAAAAACIISGALHFQHRTVLILSVAATVAGLQIFCTGVMAVYLSKVVEEVRARPTYLVAERLGAPFARGRSAPERQPGEPADEAFCGADGQPG